MVAVIDEGLAYSRLLTVIPEAEKVTFEFVVKSLPLKVTLLIPCCPTDIGESADTVGAGSDATVRHSQPPGPPSGFLTPSQPFPSVAVGDTFAVVVNVVALTTVVLENETPIAPVTFAPASNWYR